MVAMEVVVVVVDAQVDVDADMAVVFPMFLEMEMFNTFGSVSE